MPILKKKISELPLADNLKGLYTIGVKLMNGVQTSVKVGLEFIKTAYDDAVTATKNANDATSKANAAANNADNKAASANDAAEKAIQSASKVDDAVKRANDAADYVNKTIGVIIPTALSISYPERLTYGNVEPKYIKAKLSPDNVMQNIIFISDNKAVEVGTDGRISIVAVGRSSVNIIPTCNTALAKTILIEVGGATIRLVKRNQLRFMQSGAMRLN